MYRSRLAAAAAAGTFASLAASLAAMPLPVAAAPSSGTNPSPDEIVAASPAGAWQAIDPADLLVIDLASGAQLVVELAPAFAPVHVANIRALARAGWFDGGAVVRVQDDYVVQWVGADEKTPLPAGVVATPPAEYERALAGLSPRWLGAADSYAARTGHAGGWPIASDGRHAWLTHCYAMVGVGRDMPPDTGSGTELYTVIGQAPRHLDRNIALVGRVIMGVELLSALPRGTGAMGFYKAAAERTAIRRARIAADMPAGEGPRFEALRDDSATFAAYAGARANRRDPFFVRPAGGADICNVPVPVRRVR